MRIKTVSVLAMFIFGGILAITAASTIITSLRVQQASQLGVIAGNIAQGASDLSYLTNDYVIYREKHQLARWQSRFKSFSADVARLKARSPEQQELVLNIQLTTGRLKSVLEDIAANPGPSRLTDPSDPGMRQIAWSRITLQSLTLIADASRLSQLLRAEERRAMRMNILVMFAMIGTIGVYFLVNTVIVQRRILRGISKLRHGTAIIGSGSLDHVIDEEQRDEIGDLSHAFNQMTAQLRATTVSRDSLLREVEERKLAEEALRQSERRLRTFFESDMLGTIYWKIDGQITDANSKFLQMVGYSREDLIAGKVDWAQMTPPEYGEMDEFALGELKSAGVDTPYEKEYIRKDGTRIPIIIGAAMLDDSHHEGVAFVLDITDRKRAEEALKRTAENLERSNKDLQHFAYVASHDLQEPLRTIHSYLQLIERRYGQKLDGEMREFFHFVTDGAARLQALILDLLTYSRVRNAERSISPADSGKALEEALNALDEAIKGSGAVVMRDPLPVVKADAHQISLLFQNLIANAIKFSKKEETPIIRISAVEENSHWLFSVRDNGIGINSKYHDRIFTIFQRLHTIAEYKGSGVGLAICKRIVERHGGQIWVESEEGQGSTFHFTISRVN